MALPNRYKDTLDNINDNLDAKFLNLLRLIDKRSRNMSRSKGNLMRLLEELFR